MNSEDFYDFEGRRYVSPTVSRDAQLGFIDTLRDTMGQENQRIATQTERLGTAIPSDLGGLGGSNSYFTQRYQTMPVENTVATLRATAQAKALNDLMSNYEAQARNRYQQAYRKASTSGGGGGGDGDEDEGAIEFEDTTEAATDSVTPPNMNDYYISGEEQTQRIVERTGLPDWLVNVLKIFGSTN